MLPKPTSILSVCILKVSRVSQYITSNVDFSQTDLVGSLSCMKC